MTCVAAISANKKVYMGIDSACCIGDRADLSNSKIIIKKKDIICGIAGDARLQQLLQYDFKVPKKSKSKKNEDYIYTDFIKKIDSLLEDRTEISSKQIIIGYKGQIYYIGGPSLGIYHSDKNYNAIGSGSQIALGSLFSTESLNLEPNQRLEIALSAASLHCNTVKPPFKYLEL